MKQLLVLTLVLICLIAPASAVTYENRIVNGGFETGDFTGWSHFANSITTNPSYIHSGSYALSNYNASGNAWAEQVVNLTGVTNITFYRAYNTVDIYIDGVKKYTNDTYQPNFELMRNIFVLPEVYTGDHTIRFYSYCCGYVLDDVTAYAEIPDAPPEQTTPHYDYTITHNLGREPAGVLVTLTKPNETVSVISKNATAFVIWIANINGSYGSPQTVYWWVF